MHATPLKSVRCIFPLILATTCLVCVFAGGVPSTLRAQTVAEAVEIDPNAASHPFPHFWEQMFGSGRAMLVVARSTIGTICAK